MPPAKNLQGALELLALPGEGGPVRAAMRQAVHSGRLMDNVVHDAYIAASLVESGVREFRTEDRDFARCPGVKVVHRFG